MKSSLWPAILAERVAEAWLHSDHPEWHGGHEAAREIAQLLLRQPTPPQLSETAAHILRTLRDRRCSTGESIRLRMRDDGGAGSILWHGGATIGVQSVTVRRATFERLHRLTLIEYDRDNPNGGKLYKLTPLGAAALRVYELEQKEAAGQ